MADPRTYRPAPGTVPDQPGVYRFRDSHHRVIYVGKAKSLRSRLAQYFADLASLHPRTQAMVTTAASVDWVTVGTEVEALTLEYSWIKEYDPRFNVRYRDDKSYPYLAVTAAEKFPRAVVMRGQKRIGTKYYGPYTHAWAIRETLDVLVRVFPIRTCSNGVFRRAELTGRACLLGYIDKCAAPCVGKVDAQQYREIVLGFIDFMSGNTGVTIKALTAEMSAAATALEYEKAARIRDNLGALQRVLERNAVVLSDATDADMFAMAADELEAAVQIFHIRQGRITGQRGQVVERTIDADESELMAALLTQFYGGDVGEPVPAQVLVSDQVADVQQLTSWLRERRGSGVKLSVPQRGAKRALMAELHTNAQAALARHKTKRGGDLTTRSQALGQIQQALDLESAPLRMECFDISHLQGTDQVASMVVFEDGLPRANHYRTFNIRNATDDVAAIFEVITRRGQRILADRERLLVTEAESEAGAAHLIDPATATAAETRFAYEPSLLVVDGGQPQVNAARAALDQLGLADVAVCGLAKRLEEIWLPADPDPVIMDRTSEGLFLLQRLRDEAHRFAIKTHRAKRGKRMTKSVLDDIPGVGPARRKALLTKFGSIRALRAAEVTDIASVAGIGEILATSIKAAIAESPATAINTSTGEILE